MPGEVPCSESNSFGLPGFSRGWYLPEDPVRCQELPIKSSQVPTARLLPALDMNLRFGGRVAPCPLFNTMVPVTGVPSQYQRYDHIVT